MYTDLLIACLALVGLITQRILGFGAGFFLVPVLLANFSPPVTITVTLGVGSVASIILLYQDRSKLELSWSIIWWLLITAVPGLLLGVYVVTHINKAWLQIIAGFLIVVTVLIQQYAFPNPTKKLRADAKLTITGFMSGFLNAAAALAQMPILLWMRAHITTPNQVRHTLAVIFIAMNTFSMVVINLLKPHSLSSKALWICAMLLPIIIVGNVIGARAVNRINIKLYNKLVLVAIIASGLSSVALGIRSLT